MQSKEDIAGSQWSIRRFNWSWKADPEREGIHISDRSPNPDNIATCPLSSTSNLLRRNEVRMKANLICIIYLLRESF